MEIKFKLKGKVFSLCIGRRTPWFEQVWFIVLYEEDYVNREVVYANILWTAFREEF